MDISVSGLNGRLASKLPPELPMGLVFVVGQVEQVEEKRFILTEGDHHLLCQSEEDVEIHLKDEVRASGHLMFDAEKLQYYLLARDVEIVSAEPFGASIGSSRELLAESEGLLSALAAVKARADAAPHSGEELPIWVRKLAPPEVEVETAELGGDAGRSELPHAELDDELVSMLSEAMDSGEEFELTSELLAKYMPEPVLPVVETAVSQKPQEKIEPIEVVEPLAELATRYQPTSRQDTDWLVILLIISFFVLTIAAVVTIVLLLLQ